MPSIEDAQLVRRIRRELDKRQLDFTRTEIEADKGRVRIAGNITFLKDVTRIRVKSEVADILVMLQKFPGVYQITCDARIIEPPSLDEQNALAEQKRARSGRR
jgi:hypothetical protein